MSKTFLAAVGDVHDPITWSGIPYHFLQAGQALGFLDDGLRLSASGASWKTRRLLWNGWRSMTGRGVGGYQYSRSFLENLWRHEMPRLRDSRTINCFQLFPPSIVGDQRYRKIFYVDMTLKQLFEFYQVGHTIGSAIAREALERERVGYHAAELVVGHSRWAAQSVIDDYGISPEKVGAIVPGANLDRRLYQEWFATSMCRIRNKSEPLKLIFVGKYWDRKGLDRLLEALKLVHAQGKAYELTVMGCQRSTIPTHLQNVPQVNWVGFLDKRNDTKRFFDLVASADVGCLLSRAEAGGMVLREYHALGLIVMGTTVGGSPEHMFVDAGKGFAPEDNAETIAEWIVQLIDDHEYYTSLREAARKHRSQATWDETVQQWRTLLC